MKKLLFLLILLGCEKSIATPTQPIFSPIQSVPADTAWWIEPNTQVAFKWNSVTDNYSDVTYNIYKVLDDDLSVIDSLMFIINKPDTFLTLTKPDSGFHRYGVQAEDTDGNKSGVLISPVLVVPYIDTTPPPIPGDSWFEFSGEDFGIIFTTPFLSEEDATNNVPIIVGVKDTQAVKSVEGLPVQPGDMLTKTLSYKNRFFAYSEPTICTLQEQGLSYFTVQFEDTFFAKDYSYFRYIVNEDSLQGLIFDLYSDTEFVVFVTNDYTYALASGIEQVPGASILIEDILSKLEGFKIQTAF